MAASLEGGAVILVLIRFGVGDMLSHAGSIG